MTHAARTHLTWMSVLVVVAFSASYVTWHYVSRTPKGVIVNGTSVAKMLKNQQSASSKAWGLFKVNRSLEHDRLSWRKEEEETDQDLITLDENKQWIIVKEKGVYLIYIQVTFGLQIGNGSIDLHLKVDCWHTQNYTEKFTAAYDTRELTEKNQDAHLSAFIILNLEAEQKLSVRVSSKERVKYSDVEPFSNYFTIIKYADGQGG